MFLINVEVRDNVCAALSAEFQNLRRFFRGAVCNPNRSECDVSGNEYVFTGLGWGGVGVIPSYRKFWISQNFR